jgi:hypothetical protein
MLKTGVRDLLHLIATADSGNVKVNENSFLDPLGGYHEQSI